MQCASCCADVATFVGCHGSAVAIQRHADNGHDALQQGQGLPSGSLKTLGDVNRAHCLVLPAGSRDEPCCFGVYHQGTGFVLVQASAVRPPVRHQAGSDSLEVVHRALVPAQRGHVCRPGAHARVGSGHQVSVLPVRRRGVETCDCHGAVHRSGGNRQCNGPWHREGGDVCPAIDVLGASGDRVAVGLQQHGGCEDVNILALVPAQVPAAGKQGRRHVDVRSGRELQCIRRVILWAVALCKGGASAGGSSERRANFARARRCPSPTGGKKAPRACTWQGMSGANSAIAFRTA